MNKSVYEVLDKIERIGYQAYLVGGYPRDCYLGKETNDFDICTNAKPEHLKSLFSDILEENYGSLKIKYKDVLVEITTFRLEQDYIPPRAPVITYTNSLEQDLQRRDFIINTLCMDKEENYIDVLGAREDLGNRIIKLVGDASKKMKEDPLRILRAIRFATVLDFKIDENLKEAIIENKNSISTLSYYRKKEELDKIFLSSNCYLGIELLKEYGLDKILECDFSKIVIVPNLEAMWAQIKCSSYYPFTKMERKRIDIIRYFLSKGRIEDIDLYYYDLDLMLIVATILGKDLKIIKERHESLSIKSRKDINVDISFLHDISKKDINSTFSLLEEQIISKRLKNDSKSIETYLKEYFK